MSFTHSLSESSACEALWFQQYFCPVSQLYAVSSLFAIEVQHSALLSVQLWSANEPADTNMGTGRQVHAGSLLPLYIGDEVLGGKHLCVVLSIALLVDGKVLRPQLDGLVVLRLNLENEGDAAEMPEPKTLHLCCPSSNQEGGKGRRTCVLWQPHAGGCGHGPSL